MKICNCEFSQVFNIFTWDLMCATILWWHNIKKEKYMKKIAF